MGTAVVPYLLEFKAYQYDGGDWVLQWDDSGPPVSPELFDRSMRDARGLSRVAIDLVVSKMPAPKRYLYEQQRNHVWAAMVLQFGREFSAEEAEPWHCRKPWQCFGNTSQLVRDSGGRIHYAEGVCLTPTGHHLHAWGVCDGRVLDYTYPAPHLNRYFGMIFDLEFLDEMRMTTGGVFCRWDPVLEYLLKKSEA